MMDWKKLKPKNPVLFALIALFIVVNVVDSITAFFILPGEANPVFILLGSIWPIILLKIIITAVIIFYAIRNIYPNHLMYYLIIVILVLGILTIGLASYGNILGMLNPDEVAAAADIPDDVKIKVYFEFAKWYYYAPLIFCLVTFMLYDTSHKKVRVDPEHFKRKKWWKRW